MDLSSVDFEKVDSILDFSDLLMRAGNSIGIFESPTPLQCREATILYQTAKEWVNAVKRQLRTMSPADALYVIDTYEIIHYIAYRTPASAAETNHVRLSAFDAMIHGDRNVDCYVMFRAIRNAVRQREKAFFDKPLTWSCITEERWHKEAVEGFDLTSLSDYDILSRVVILLESDLFAYEGSRQDQFKQHLAMQYSHYLNGYEAPDRRTSIALNNFRILYSRYTSP
ncbi:MAG: hypothetical protein K2F63_01205, partial [Muribaculaceae bacterium]|nr:hypothetical protein [Muribaculaceae bacterium]